MRPKIVIAYNATPAAAELLGDRAFEVWPVFGETVADGIDDLAGDQGAELIVLGSPHHGAAGRALLGNAAEAASSGAPCAIAVAPRSWWPIAPQPIHPTAPGGAS